MSAGEHHGQVLADRFELLETLGSGGMGVVHRARDLTTGTEVALKTMRSDDVDSLIRFKNEFRLCADVRHRNLARLGELVEWRGKMFLTMELVDGVDLIQWIRTPGWGARDSRATPRQLRALDGDARVASAASLAFDEPRLRDVLRQLAEGVSALHAAGLLHRDLKPSNVLVTRDGRVVILDFGLAVRHAEGRQLSDVIAVGSAAYMAPEQAAASPVGPAADWYAVGAMLYEALTGRLPHEGDVAEVLAAKLQLDAPEVATFAPGAPTDLATLCDELVRRDPARRPTGAAVLRRLSLRLVRAGDAGGLPPVAGAPALLGRRAELDQLRAAFAAAQRGGTMQIVVGESGIGKTVLIEQAVAELRAAVPGLVVLESRCRARESLAFKAFDGAVDQLVRWLEQADQRERDAILPVRAGRLGQLFPALRQLPTVAAAVAVVPPVGDLADARRAAYQVFRDLLGRLAERRPLVLVIDDLHHADPDSVELLAHVLDPDDAPRLLVLATSRPAPVLDDLAARVRDRRIAQVAQLVMPPLDERATRELVERGLARRGDAAVGVDAIVAASGGHPGFVLELVRAALAPGAAGVVEPRVAVDELLRRRVSRLRLPARELLYLVVAAEGPLSVAAAAAAATDGNLAALLDHLDELLEQHLVVASGRSPDDSIEPYHDRVTDAIREELDAASMRSRHEALAIALEAVDPDGDPVRILRHWLAAGRVEHARKIAAGAAERAFDALELRRAAWLYQLALQAPQPAADELRLRTALGDALAVLGDADKAAEAYLAAAGLATASAARSLRRRAAEQFLATGRVADGLALLEEILRDAGMPMARSPRAAVARLLWSRARLWWRDLRAPMPPGEVSEHLRVCLSASWAASVGLSTVDTVQGADYQARMVRFALDSGDRSALCRALAVETAYVAASGVGSATRVAALLDRARALAAETGDPRDAAWIAFSECAVPYLHGRFVEAAQAAVRARERLAEVPGANWERRTLLLFESLSSYHLGDFTRFEELVGRGLRDALAIGDLYTSVQLRLTFVNARWLIQDELEAARAHARRAIAEWTAPHHQMQHNYYAIAMAQADLYAGDGVAAFRRAHEGWARARAAHQLGVELIGINFEMLVGRAAIAAAAAVGLDSQRASLLDQASRFAHALERRPAPWGRGQAALLRALVAVGRGDRDGGLAGLVGAEALLEASSMRAYAAAARVRRGELVGGDAGLALVTSGHAALVATGVRRPDRLIAMLAPAAPA